MIHHLSDRHRKIIFRAAWVHMKRYMVKPGPFWRSEKRGQVSPYTFLYKPRRCGKRFFDGTVGNDEIRAGGGQFPRCFLKKVYGETRPPLFSSLPQCRCDHNIKGLPPLTCLHDHPQTPRSDPFERLSLLRNHIQRLKSDDNNIKGLTLSTWPGRFWNQNARCQPSI